MLVGEHAPPGRKEHLNLLRANAHLHNSRTKAWVLDAVAGSVRLLDAIGLGRLVEIGLDQRRGALRGSAGLSTAATGARDASSRARCGTRRASIRWAVTMQPTTHFALHLCDLVAHLGDDDMPNVAALATD